MSEPQTDKKRTMDPLFSQTDYLIALRGIAHLSELDFEIVAMRFWENRSLMEIGAIISMPTKYVEERLTEIYQVLKQFCLNEPYFSRNHTMDLAA